MPNRFQVGDEKMGGIISITIRLPDGTEYRTQRWTNPFIYWFHDVRFLTKDIDFIMSYLKGWLDMKADYETKAFKLPGTFRYFPSKGLVPVEYGIWVIDLQKNEIVDYYQNYTDLTRLSFDFDLNANDSSDVEEMNRITQLLLDHRLSCEGEGFSYQSFDELRQGHPKYRDIYVDLSPLKLTRYEPYQTKEALAHIQKLGFVLNATELRIWDEWIKEYQKNHVLNKDFIYCPSCGDKVYSDVMENYDADGQWECGACGYRFVLEGIH
jgi:ribosomal protein S27AE